MPLRRPFIHFISCRTKGVQPEEVGLFRSAFQALDPSIEVYAQSADTLSIDEFTQVRNSGVIIGGSDASVNDILPWIPKLQSFITYCHESNIALLGICFGHQLIAKTLAYAIVDKDPKGREFGRVSIELTAGGMGDHLFLDIPDRFSALATHRDSVICLPQNQGVRILASNNHGVQSLGIGRTTRTVQFHPECLAKNIASRACARKTALMEEGFFENEAEYTLFLERLGETPDAQKILANWYRQFVVWR